MSFGTTKKTSQRNELEEFQILRNKNLNKVSFVVLKEEIQSLI